MFEINPIRNPNCRNPKSGTTTLINQLGCSLPHFIFNCNQHHIGSVTDEEQDMWKVYLDLKEYATILANSSSYKQSSNFNTTSTQLPYIKATNS